MLFLLLFLIPALYWDTVIYQVSSEFLRRAVWVGRYVIGVCLWLTFAWFLIRLIDDIGWPLLLEGRLGYAIPRLLKDLVRLIVVAIAVGVIISVVFEKSITGFLAASGMVGLVLGFALQHMIADFFSGIALNLERSFAIGDRVKIEDSELTGDIVEINWRTTVIQDFSSNYLIIPNSRMARMKVENYHKPVRAHYNWHFLTLDFDVPIERAERILLAAMKHAQAPFGVTTAPIARVRLPNERGMEYIVVYEVPEYRFRGRMRAAMMRSIMHHLKVAGIRPVYPQYNLYTGKMPLEAPEQQPNPYDLLKRVSLFTVLDDTEMAELAARMTPKMFTAGDAIVEQGAPGASMYMVAEGLLYVYIRHAETGNLLKVAEFIPGQFLGEMALLTGEPRSATVKAETDTLLYEITKEDMEILFEKRPEIADSLSQVMAQRLLQRETFMQNLPVAQQKIEVQNFASQLLQKMRGFFNVFRQSQSVSRDIEGVYEEEGGDHS
jgi:small-conductance mechanosensitive channel/CRP-like cAMP-binding protein